MRGGKTYLGEIERLDPRKRKEERKRKRRWGEGGIYRNPGWRAEANHVGDCVGDCAGDCAGRKSAKRGRRKARQEYGQARG